jgi:hypothetical protein
MLVVAVRNRLEQLPKTHPRLLLIQALCTANDTFAALQPSGYLST